MFEILLAKIAKALAVAKIDYMVIGGQAVLLYGEPRHTQDIDITLGADTDKLPLVIKLAKKLKLRILVESPESFVRRTMVLPVADHTSGTRVDFIFSTSQYEKIALSRAVTANIGGTAVNYVSVDDLIIHKIISGRPRDIEDVKSILLKNPDFDRKYIKRWLKDFEHALNISLLSVFKKLIKEIK